MHVGVVGSGYVETTLAACLADLGHDVTAIDVNEDVAAALNDGRPGIEEPDLTDIVVTHAGLNGTGRLRATTDYGALGDATVVFLALPTPSREDGSVDT